jgi:hypothetical protein
MELTTGVTAGASWAWSPAKSRRYKVFSLVMLLVLPAVIVLSLAAGVGLGYAIIFGILYVFDRSRQSMKAAPPRALTTSAGND